MKNMKFRWFVLKMFFVCIIAGLVPYSFAKVFDTKTPGYIHREMAGIVSVEAEHFFKSNEYKESFYYTGNVMAPVRHSETGSAYLMYLVRFDTPGIYSLYVLGNRLKRDDSDTINLTVHLLDNDTLTIQSGILDLPDMYAPVWFKSGSSSDGFTIAEPGQYFLKFKSESKNFSIDKFVLSSITSFAPTGTGPDETSTEMKSMPDSIGIVLPPAWAFGVLYGGYTNQKQTENAVKSLIEGDFPVDAYWIDSYFWDFNKGKGPGGYINFQGDTHAFPDKRAMWDYFEKNEIKAGIWIWNLINQEGNEAVFADFKDKGYFSSVYRNTNGWHNASKNTMTGRIDFENEEAVAYWKKQLNPFFESGLDFLKLDNSSAIPYCKTAFNATQEMGKETRGRGFILAHLHSTYDERFKLYPTKWTGDAMICWDQPDYPNLGIYAMGGFRQNIAMVADPKRTTYEIPFLAHDAGGYDYFGSQEQSDELYIRWIQFAALNSVMTIFSTAKNPTRNHPYNYPAFVQDNFKKYTHLRMRLFPYIYSHAILTRLTGKKIVQGDGMHEYQYMFGNALLVAPVFNQGAREKTLCLPAGTWIDYETDEVFLGGREITVAAPLSKIPVFVKSGAIIPLRNYARAIELGNNDTLTVQIYPSDALTSFTLYEDDGTSNDYLSGIYSETTFSVHREDDRTTFKMDAVKGSFENMNSTRFYRLNFHLTDDPEQVLLNGKKVLNKSNLEIQDESYWEYEANKQELWVNLSSLKDKPNSIEIRCKLK